MSQLDTATNGALVWPPNMFYMGDVSRVANELRFRSGQHLPIYSIHRIVEICFPGIVITGRSLPSGVNAIVAKAEDGSAVVYRRGISSADQRFAIATGLAHLCFADAPDSHRDRNFSNEARAEQFAAELLVPADEIRPLIEILPSHTDEDETYLDQVDKIASTFHVPAWVIDKRIRDLERYVMS